MYHVERIGCDSVKMVVFVLYLSGWDLKVLEGLSDALELFRMLVFGAIDRLNKFGSCGRAVCTTIRAFFRIRSCASLLSHKFK